MKKALIIGSNGQDGKILTKYLQNKNFEVIGITREDPFLMYDLKFLAEYFSANKINQIYYLAAHHHSSGNNVEQDGTEFYACFKTHVEYIKNILEVLVNVSHDTRVFYASSSLIYGMPKQELLNENSEKNPICDYGITKKIGMDIIKWYREKYNLFACSGILFNHESHFRSPNFLSRKIIQTAVKIKKGEADKLILGDLNAQTDWGYAPDFCDAFYRMLIADKPYDYVISSGELHKVQDWIEQVFSLLDLDWEKYIIEDKSLITRKKPVMIGDNSKIKKELDWLPETSFNDIIKKMLEEELKNYD
ncbi:GDP-mannose 4,6-dehydratase [bacterium]|nr:GDP-mannose 4,6-dehydratase [bacterium]